MKKITYLLFLAMGVTACSVESMDSTENLLTADAKVKIQEVGKSMSLKAVEICEGDAPVFVFNFPQNMNGPHNANTDIKIQLETSPGSGEWIEFVDLTYSGSGPKEYTYEDEVMAIETYSFRAKIGAGGFEYFATLNVVDCSDCEESFTYVDNGDGTYKFTYIPGEDMVNAEVVFTFAQGVAVSGYEWDWNGKSSTRTESMNLNACEEYSWTIGLEADCAGKSGQSNVWTDFKVNGDSKKADPEDKFTVNCN